MATREPTFGKWVVAFCVDGGPFLLFSVGDKAFWGHSLGNHLDKLGSVVLSREANKARWSRKPIDIKTRWDDVWVRVVVEPLLFEEQSGSVMGICAIALPLDADLPPKPKFGRLEWMVDASTSETIKIAWDEGMYSEYELDPRVVEAMGIDRNTWLATLVARGSGSKTVFEEDIDQALKDRDGFPYLTKYFIHPAGDRAREKELEIAGWVTLDRDNPKLIWLRGFVRSARPETPYNRPMRPSSQDLFQQVMRLADDRMILRVDPRTWRFRYEASIWESFGLKGPEHAYFLATVHPDDLRGLLDGFPSGESPIGLRLRRDDGGWRGFNMHWRDAQELDLVLCDLRPTE